MTKKGERIWIITEAVNEFGLRYCSTILKPKEYGIHPDQSCLVGVTPARLM